jgi:hypothetical protein
LVPVIKLDLYKAVISEEVCSIEIFGGYTMFVVENQVGSFSLALALLSICPIIVFHSMFGNGFFCKASLVMFWSN